MADAKIASSVNPVKLGNLMKLVKVRNLVKKVSIMSLAKVEDPLKLLNWHISAIQVVYDSIVELKTNYDHLEDNLFPFESFFGPDAK